VPDHPLSDKARKSFPNMPKEVFQAWIEPNLEPYGLPLDKPIWNNFFCCLPIRYWARLMWELRSIEPSENAFDGESLLRFNWIISNVTLGYQTPTADVEKTSERFWAAATFIQQNGVLPGPPIIGDRWPERLRLVDGHHRLAALFHTGIEIESIPVWVGSV
jgi:hypothetical protein